MLLQFFKGLQSLIFYDLNLKNKHFDRIQLHPHTALPKTQNTKRKYLNLKIQQHGKAYEHFSTYGDLDFGEHSISSYDPDRACNSCTRSSDCTDEFRL